MLCSQEIINYLSVCCTLPPLCPVSKYTTTEIGNQNTSSKTGVKTSAFVSNWE